jgi:hypothetical protein
VSQPSSRPKLLRPGRAALAALATLTLLAPSASAEAPADAARSFKYELRSVGARQGQAVLSIGERTKVGDRWLRSVRLEARTEGLLGRLYRAGADATTWIDDHWLPVRAHWEGFTKTGKRRVDVRYEGRRILGEYDREGQPLKKTDRKLVRRTTDTVSVFAWLMNQDLKPGQRLRQPLFAGTRIYWLTIEVGEPERIMVPVGLRVAYPVKVVATRGKKYRREATYYLGVDDGVPYKLSFSYGLVGAVEAVLIGSRTG